MTWRDVIQRAATVPGGGGWMWMALWAMLHVAWGGMPRSSPDDVQRALIEAEATLDDAEVGSVVELDTHFDPAFAAAARTRSPRAAALVRLRIGDACRKRGWTQLALYEYEQGVVGLRSNLTGSEVASTAAARAATNLGIKSFATSRALVQDLEWPPERAARQWMAEAPALEAALWTGIGNLYQQQGQLDPAAAAYREARKLADTHGIDDMRGVVRVNQAWLSLRRGDAQPAIEALDELARTGLLDSTKQRIQMRSAWLARGEVLVRQEQHAEAHRLLTEAESLYEAAGDTEGLSLVRIEQAAALEGLDRSEEALQVYERARKDASGDARWAAPLGAARLLRAAGHHSEAMSAYRSYLEAIEQIARGFNTDEGRFSVLQTHARNLDDMVALAVDIGEPDLVHEVTRRARQRSLPALLGRASSGAARPPGILPAERLTTDRAGPRIAEQIAVSSTLGPRRSAGDDRSVSRAGSALALPPGTTALGYTLLPDRIVATITHAPPGGTQRTRFVVTDIAEATLATWIMDLRASLGAGRDPVMASRGIDAIRPATADGASRLPRTLYDLLVTPVEAHLPPSGAPLVVIPDGVLWSLPWAALQSPDGSWFADRPHTLAPSEGALAGITQQARPARDRALILGNPGAHSVYGCQSNLAFSALPAADREARDIAALRGWTSTDLLLGDQADALRLDAWHSGYGVLHLATHGLACGDDPLESFLVLAQPPSRVWRSKGESVTRRDDPRLPVRRELSVTGAAGPPRVADVAPTLTARHVVDTWSLQADLVTLSACESGLGQTSSEGMIGLTRAFLAAGARTLLVSLWKVEDRPTQELMVAFYDGYLEHGDKALALRDAMTQVRERFPEPRRWAAFTVVGAAR